MAKWVGQIGFVTEQNDGSGIVITVPIEKTYVGDFYRNTRRLNNGEGVNYEVAINNQISVISDPFMQHNFHTIRYVTYMGVKWTVDTVEVQYPRLVLNLGGEYVNG